MVAARCAIRMSRFLRASYIGERTIRCLYDLGSGISSVRGISFSLSTNFSLEALSTLL